MGVRRLHPPTLAKALFSYTAVAGCRGWAGAAVGVANHEEALSIILVTVPRFYVRTAHIIRPAHLLIRDIDLPHRGAYAH